MVWWQEIFGPEQTSCYFHMDEPAADDGQGGIPELEPGIPAGEPAQGVVISKNISLSFNGAKPVTIPPHFLVEDYGS